MDTGNVINMKETFKDCWGIDNGKVDCSNWNVTNVKNHDGFRQNGDSPNTIILNIILPKAWQ